MRLHRRVEKLEAGTPRTWRYHFLITEAGYLEDPPLMWEAKHNAALTAYGREKIGPDDVVRYVHLIYPEER